VQEPAHEEEEEEEEKDPNKPDLDLDDVVECLSYYFDKKQERENSTDPLVNPTKKKSNFQTDEQKEENDQRKEKAFWEKCAKVLPDKGHSLWKALDKALTKYYALLVER
jgi:hypothetical protein